MKKIFSTIALLLYCFIALLSPAVSMAGPKQLSGPGCELTGAVGAPADVPSLACLAPIIVNVINVAFMFLGFVAVVFLLYGSIRFILSRGDQKAVTAAKNTITYAIIGTVLIVLAFVLITIFTNLLGFPNILETFTLYQQ